MYFKYSLKMNEFTFDSGTLMSNVSCLDPLLFYYCLTFDHQSKEGFLAPPSAFVLGKKKGRNSNWTRLLLFKALVEGLIVESVKITFMQ